MRIKNRDTRIEALREVGVFDGLPKSDLSVLAKHCDVVDREAGTVLAEEGHVGQQLVYIATGAAEVRKNGRKLATLGPGDVIGEMSLLDGEKASATVTLTEESHLLVMSVQDFQTVMATLPNFHIKLLRTLAKRLRAADKKLVG